MAPDPPAPDHDDHGDGDKADNLDERRDASRCVSGGVDVRDALAYGRQVVCMSA